MALIIVLNTSCVSWVLTKCMSTPFVPKGVNTPLFYVKTCILRRGGYSISFWEDEATKVRLDLDEDPAISITHKAEAYLLGKKLYYDYTHSKDSTH